MRVFELTFCWDGAGCDDAPGDRVFSAVPSALLALLGSSAACFRASASDRGFDWIKV